MKRAYEALLTEFLELFPCVAIVGVRQCGKSSLLQTLPKSWRILDLEQGGDFDELTRDPDLFFRQNPANIAIDEAQLAPEVFPALRVAIDQNRKKRGRFIITGSSSPELNNRISETLAGRVATIEMSPLSYSEIASKKNSQMSFYDCLKTNSVSPRNFMALTSSRDGKSLGRYWYEGGYPEPWLRKNSRFQSLWFENYIADYLRRDLSALFPKLDTVRFRRFLGILAGYSGTSINLSELGRALDVSQPTAKDYLDIAHYTFVWRKILPFDRNVKKRIVKHPRGYLRDSGLLHRMLGIPSYSKLLQHPHMGRSWECFVIEEILRNLNALGVPHEAFFYRTGAGAEVDLILEGAFGTIPIEIKYGTPQTKQLRSLRDFVEEQSCPLGIIVSNDVTPRLYSENIVSLPFLNL